MPFPNQSGVSINITPIATPIETIDMRSAGIVPTTWEDSTSHAIEGYNQLQLLITCAKGQSDGILIAMQFSNDEIDWWNDALAGVRMLPIYGTTLHYETLIRSMTKDGSFLISIPICAKFMRMRCQSLNNEADTSLQVKAMLGVA